MNETELIKKAQIGDNEAFGEIFKIYGPKALRMVYLSTGNKHTSEDVVQEAFVKCYFELKNLKNPETFKVWFYKMLSRLMWRYVGRERRVVPVENMIEEGTSPDTSLSDNIEKEENRIELLKALSKLDLSHRAVVILYYFNEMSVKEIAKVLGCFEGTVKSRLHSARNKLKKTLEKENFTNSDVYPKGCGLYEVR